MDRVLQVRARDEVEALWAMEKALTSGTSSAVISWVEQLDHKDKRRLQLVAKSARAMGFVLETNATAETTDSLPKLQAVH
jgi:cell division inhibitor SulA